MEKTYELKSSVKLSTGFFAAIFIIASIVLFVVMLSSPRGLILVPIVLLFSAILLISRFSSSVTLAKHSIRRKTAFYTRELLVAGAKGYRLDSKSIVIEPANASGQKIRVTEFNSFANGAEIANWVRANFIDLNKLDLEASKEGIAANTSLGFTVEEREKKAGKIRQIALAYNIWGVVLGVIVVMLKGTIMAILTCFIYLLLGIALMKFTYGLVKFLNNSSRCVYSAIPFGIAAPAFGLLFTAIDFNLLSFHNGWLPTGLAALALFILLSVTGFNKYAGLLFWQFFLMLLLSVAYGVIGVLSANGVLDKSVAMNYKTIVTGKYTTSSKSGKNYHLMIAGWRKGVESQSVDVKESTFDQMDDGTPVFIQEKRGWLNIPWFDFFFTPPAPAGSGSGNFPNPR